MPRNPDFSLDVERIIKVVEQEKPKCIFLTSPNNPDGRYYCSEPVLSDILLKQLSLLKKVHIVIFFFLGSPTFAVSSSL